MVSTSGDLARWVMALYGGQVVSAGSVGQMTAGVPAKTGQGDQYGFGCQIRPSAYGPTWGHSGWFPGWLSDVHYFPEKKMAIAVQFNSDNPRASGRPMRAIVADIAKEFVGGG
jgi:D-alanyl-D-alanine carboxypeptidase